MPRYEVVVISRVRERYVVEADDSEAVNALEDYGSAVETEVDVQNVEVTELEGEPTQSTSEKRVPETLTVDDLWRVYIRAQDEEGRWKNISVEETTDKQFNTWAHSRLVIQGDGGQPWPPEERADFCDALYQQDALVVLMGERTDYEESDHAEAHRS